MRLVIHGLPIHQSSTRNYGDNGFYNTLSLSHLSERVREHDAGGGVDALLYVKFLALTAARGTFPGLVQPLG